MSYDMNSNIFWALFSYMVCYFVSFAHWGRTTICPRRSDPFYIVSYYIKWVTNSWTDGMIFCNMFSCSKHSTVSYMDRMFSTNLKRLNPENTLNTLFFIHLEIVRNTFPRQQLNVPNLRYIKYSSVSYMCQTY